MRRLGEPYGKEPWAILETWSWERIAIVMDCIEDEGKIAKKMAQRSRGSNVIEMTEEQFIKGLRG